MNDNAKKWVAALRSGKYKQGKNCLKDSTGGFCCLGVACELFVQEGNGLAVQEHTYSYERPVISFGGKVGSLPLIVMRWLGLSHPNGLFNGEASLVDFNDTGVPFKQIADIIEGEPLGLFAKLCLPQPGNPCKTTTSKPSGPGWWWYRKHVVGGTVNEWFVVQVWEENGILVTEGRYDDSDPEPITAWTKDEWIEWVGPLTPPVFGIETK